MRSNDTNGSYRYGRIVAIELRKHRGGVGTINMIAQEIQSCEFDVDRVLLKQ